MSEAVQEAPASDASTEPQGGETEQEPRTFDADYVANLRKEAAKYRTEARAGAEAQKRLAEIEEANKTEVQKAADRLKAAETEAIEARREASRYKIASEFNLSLDDAAALEHVATEDGMRLVAQRLAGVEKDRKKQGNHVPREGTTSTAPEGDDRETVRRLFGG